VVVTVLVVGALLAAPASGLALTGASDPAQTETPVDSGVNETAADEDSNASDVAPGARLSGVLGVQEAEVEGELESRSFGIAVSRARSNDSKAGVIARQVRRSDQRIETLAERRERLEAARENGSISGDQYRARIARLEAETETVRRLATLVEAESEGLPPGVLARSGVDATAIRALGANASKLTSPETSRIARSIAGPGVGRGLANATAEGNQRGPPGQDGDDGERGPPGQDGDDGERGPPGQDGDDGERGPPGQDGDDGERGPPGQNDDGDDDRGPPGQNDDGDDSDSGEDGDDSGPPEQGSDNSERGSENPGQDGSSESPG
jgi:hypothetical protein